MVSAIWLSAIGAFSGYDGKANFSGATRRSATARCGYTKEFGADAVTPQARAVIREIAALRGIDPGRIIGYSRKEKIFRARIEVARALDARGYSTSRIGAMLNKDHTTIVYYLGRGKKKPAKPRWRTPKVRHVRWLKPKPPPEKRKFYLVPYAGAYWPEYDWKERPISQGSIRCVSEQQPEFSM